MVTLSTVDVSGRPGPLYKGAPKKFHLVYINI